MKRSLGSRTLVFPIPVWVVGSYNSDGRPNLATVAWGGICCSIPPCVAISLRQATLSHGNIVQRKAFTVNVPSAHQMKEADYCGVVSGKKIDKFEAAGLTAVASENVDAPYAEEFSLVLECKLREVVELGLHTQFVGEIIDVKADESTLGATGLPDIEKVRPILYSAEAHLYYGVGQCLGEAFLVGRDLHGKS